jgi:hypothetical protein
MGVGLLIVAVAAFGLLFNNPKTETPADLGTYAYECDEHVAFSMTPSSDLKTIRITPVGGAYPPVSTLGRQVTNNGARYEGSGVVLVGHGEGVVLGEGEDALNCTPVVSQTEAPFNFGD